MPEERINPETGLYEEKNSWGNWKPKENDSGREERIDPKTGLHEEKNSWGNWKPKENDSGREERINPKTGLREEKNSWGNWKPREDARNGQHQPPSKQQSAPSFTNSSTDLSTTFERNQSSSSYGDNMTGSSDVSPRSSGAIAVFLILAVICIVLFSNTKIRSLPTQANQAGNLVSNSSTQPLNTPNIFANTTLSYNTHMSDWFIYFGRGESGQCPYFAQKFEGRGGEKERGTKSYSINSLGNGKWQILIQGTSSHNVSNIIFWTSYVNLTASDNQPVIKAVGNIYDRDGQNPLWPNGDRVMDLVFTRGNHLK